MWQVEYTDEFERWFEEDLAQQERDTVEAAVEQLEAHGPNLGRPWVDTIKTSRHHHMKELRPRGGSIRVLFAFNPVRTAILLLGGDKRGEWDAWYRDAVPLADDLYDEHLQELRDEGLI